MALGIPVISTECGGMGELIKSGYNGYLTPVRDPDSMAKTIIGLIRDKPLRNRIGKAARDQVDKN